MSANVGSCEASMVQGGVNYEQELRVLNGQVRSLRKEVRQLGELIDTINSPLLKRIWWVLKGYRFRRVGRWYGKTKR